MKINIRLIFATIIPGFALLFGSCGPQAIPSAPTPVSTPTTPPASVELGYLFDERQNHIPAVFFDYQPGVTIQADSKEKLTQTITYPSGQAFVVVFTFQQTEPFGADATVNGVARSVPTAEDFLSKVKPTLQDKFGFTFMPGGFAEPLMQIPTLCADSASFEQHYSTLPGREWIKSLDNMSLQCPKTNKKYTLLFSYERDLTSPDSLITSFTVSIDEK